MLFPIFKVIVLSAAFLKRMWAGRGIWGGELDPAYNWKQGRVPYFSPHFYFSFIQGFCSSGREEIFDSEDSAFILM